MLTDLNRPGPEHPCFLAVRGCEERRRDTHPGSASFLKKCGKIITMKTVKKRMGRPSLGPRDNFNVWLSERDGQIVRAVAEAKNCSFQSLLEPILRKAIAEFDLEAILDEQNGQEALIPRAS